MPSGSAPYSYKKYTANGSDTSFAIDFDFLDSSHLSVTIDGVTQDTSLYTYNSSTNAIVFTTAPSNGEVIVIQRTTPKSKAGFQSNVVDFVDSSVLTAADLDKGFEGILYISQEANDSGSVNALSLDKTDDVWDAEGKRIKNLPSDPTAGRDAVTKDYVDNLSLYGATTAPQSWTIEPGDWTDGSSQTVTLTDPVPLSDDDMMFFVEVDGVIQKPTTDYTITSNDGVYTLTLVSETETPTANVHVRNLGLARNVFASTISGDISFDTDTLHVDSTNNRVGMGTTTPEQELEVAESGGSPIVQVSDGTRKLQMGSDSNNPFIGTSTNHDLRIISNNTEQMRVKADGKVGIGTNAPARQLHITETGNSLIRLEGGATSSVGIEFLNSGKDATLIDSSDENLRVFTNGSERLRVLSDGKVGIGTNAPNALLHIHETDSAGVYNRLTNSGSTTAGTAIGLSSADNTVIQNEIAAKHIIFNHVKSGDGSTVTQAARITENGLHFPNGSDTTVPSSAATGLDYYIEGHIVPTISTGDGTSITLAASGAKIRYVRIGRLVTLTGRLLVSSGYATGSEHNHTAKITNLPFTCLSGTTCTTAVPLIGNFDAGGASNDAAIKITQNTKELTIGKMITNDLYTDRGANFLRTNDELFINISYMASDTE